MPVTAFLARRVRALLLALTAALLLPAIAAPAAGAAVSAAAGIVSSQVRVTYTWSAPDVPTGTMQLTFTYASGSQATVGDTWVFNTSADTQSSASGMIFVDPVTPVSAGCSSLCLPSMASSSTGQTFLPDGSYTVQVSFPSAGGTSQSNAAGVTGVDGPTATPTVTSPTSSTGMGVNGIALDYDLNEGPTAGSVTAVFTGTGACTTVSLTLTNVASQSTTISYASPATSTGVASGTGAFIRGCTYAMTLSFQDRALPAASTTVTGLLVPDVPGAPIGVTAARGLGQASVSWSAPAANGSAITSSTVTASPGGATCTATAPATSCVVSGLTNGTSYTFTVKATNGVGESAASAASAAVIPGDVPGVPAGVSAAGGPLRATVSWSAPAANGYAIASYTVTASPGGATCTATAPATSCDVTGLAPGEPRTFTVRATNAVGAGAASSPTAAVVATQLPAPTGARAAAGSERATVSWTPLGGADAALLTGYRVTTFPGGASCVASPSASSCEVPGLTNGAAYTFVVRALSSFGEGTASDPAPPVTPSAPPAPAPAPTPETEPDSACARRGLTTRAGAAVAAAKLASCAGLTVTKGARVRLSVPKAARRVCRVDGARVVGVGPGRCAVTVTVVTRSGAKTSRTVKLTVRKR